MEQAVVQSGIVNSVNYEAGTVCVNFTDLSDSISRDLPMFSNEYRMPEIGDTVVCIFLSNNPARGYCLGKPYSDGSPPREAGEGVIYQDFFGEGFLKYDRFSKTLTLHADHINLEQKGSG